MNSSDSFLSLLFKSSV